MNRRKDVREKRLAESAARGERESSAERCFIVPEVDSLCTYSSYKQKRDLQVYRSTTHINNTETIYSAMYFLRLIITTF